MALTNRQQAILTLTAAVVQRDGLGDLPATVDAVRSQLRVVLEGANDWIATADEMPQATEQAPWVGLVWVAASPTPNWTAGWNEGGETWWVRTAAGNKGAQIQDPVTYWMSVRRP